MNDHLGEEREQKHNLAHHDLFMYENAEATF